MDRPPNILFFFPDQHRREWLEANPELPLRTPNLEALAARGTRFTRAYCNSPVCAPSRAALAAGKGYFRCGVINNQQDYPLDQPTYYQSLRQAGYRVAGVGKFDLHKLTLDWGRDGQRLIDEWGFTEGVDNEGKSDGSYSCRNLGGPRGPYLDYLAAHDLAETYLEEHAQRPANREAYTTALPDDAYCDNWLASRGLDILRQFPADQPWHLVVNFTGPHGPMDVTAGMRARWENAELPPPIDNTDNDPESVLRRRQNYAAMIENIDSLAGDFMALVRERGEADNTIVIYASDHGEMLGDHDSWGKCQWRQASSGIPMLMAGPGIERGRTSDALVSLHDLAATMIDYAGAEPVPEMDAISLRALLEGRSATHRDCIVAGLDGWSMAFDGRYKLVRQGGGEALLFDLESDPEETVDIAADCPAEAARLRRLLATASLPDLPPFLAAMRQARGQLAAQGADMPCYRQQWKSSLGRLEDGFISVCRRTIAEAHEEGIMAGREAEAALAQLEELQAVAAEILATLDSLPD